MSTESISSICLTICFIAALVLVGCFIYWGLVTQRQLDVEIIKVMGAETYAQMRACLLNEVLCK